MAKVAKMRYWLFQAKPSILNLREILKAGALKTFAVKAHLEKIQPGDKVILWQTGKKAGCYALAKVVSKIDHWLVEEEEAVHYKKAPDTTPRVQLEVEYNLWNRPILPDFFSSNSVFENFNAGLPGTTYQATKKQYDQLTDLVAQWDLAEEPEPEYFIKNWLNPPLNLILYGPPGTGKTYQTINHALSIIENRPLEEVQLEKRQALRARFNEYLEEGRVAFISFHQSYAYEDFVEGIKPALEQDQVIYKVEDGLFKQMCLRAEKALSEEIEAEPSNSKVDSEPLLNERILASAPKYVLIIDEINRGNIPAIFGELITLIEPDKRAGMSEALVSLLPYSKTTFTVPPNLYLLGTMNTADRSAEVLDLALRRRFEFKELKPDPKAIARLAEAPMTVGVDLERLLQTINDRIALLLDEDYCIGHAYFLGVATLDDLKQLFSGRVLPLLQEYFFDDYAKIGLVLGNGFVKLREQSSSLSSFAEFDFPYAGEFLDKRRYELVDINKLSEVDFIRIYDPVYKN